MTSGPENLSAGEFAAESISAARVPAHLRNGWAESIIRRWWVIALATVCCLIIAGIYLGLATPQYRVAVRLTAEGPRGGIPGAAREFLLLQAEQFHDPKILQDVTGISSKSPSQPVGAEPKVEPLQQSIVATVESDADILDISFDTPHPREIAARLNGAVEAQIKRSAQQNSMAAQALADLTALRARREAERAANEQALRAFAQANPDFSTAHSRDVGALSRVTQLEQALAAARSDAAAAKTAADAAQSADPLQIRQLASAVHGDSALDALEQQRQTAETELAQLEQQAAEQKRTLLPQHPLVLRTQTQIARVKDKLAALDEQSARVYRESLQRRAQVAAKKQSELQALLDDENRSAGAAQTTSSAHAKLEAALKQSILSLAEVDAQLKAAAVPAAAAASGMQLRLLEPAQVPAAPVRPQKLAVFGGALIAGVVIGLALASVGSR
jgi:capsular polysaccharide biosynthesis protein